MSEKYAIFATEKYKYTVFLYILSFNSVLRYYFLILLGGTTMKRYCAVLIIFVCTILCTWAVEVNLNFYADGVKIHSQKVESGNTYTLNTLVSNPSGCRGYTFRGWKADGPVEGDETPTYYASTASITPSANMNLYAVYQRTGAAANRYTRITSTSDLHAGSQYLIVCFYEWDGDTYYGPSYFALGNTQEVGTDGHWWTVGETHTPTGWLVACRNTVCDVYAPKYSISASQVYPDAGTITNPANTIIWTLSGTDGAWKWTNTNVNRSLYLRRGLGQKYYECNGSIYIINGQTYNEQLLTADGNTCSVTAANGAFNLESGGYYLTYSNDENDYFQTGTTNDYTFYLYKKETEYTSFPNCANWTVHLDALDGTITGTSPASSTTDVSETSSGSGVTLPTATMSGADCSSWTFVGWNSESAIYGTTKAPSLHTGSYSPSYDGTTLYAVYQAGENTTYWEKISSKDEIVSGGVYVIATTDNYAVTTTYQNNNRFAQAAVNVAGDRINGIPAANIQWTYNGTYFTSSNGSVILSYNGSNTTYYYKPDDSSPFVLEENNDPGYYLRHTNNRFEESTTSTEFYIYKKVTTYVTYSSYPHCTPYSVTLNAAGGTIEENSEDRIRIVTEAIAGGGITLPEAAPLCDDGWVFAGWQEGSEVGSVKEVNYTGLYTGTYVPSRDGVTLYAVFKREIPKFQILYNPTEMVAGDNYIITGYSNYYDWEITSDTYSNNYLSAVQAASPQGEEGYYVVVDTTVTGWQNVMWVMNGTYDNCTFQNVGNGKYLNSTANGYTTTANTGSAYKFTTYTGEGFYWTMQDIDHNNRYMYFSYNSGNPYFLTNTTVGPGMYVYRQMKEFTSWPHCEPFTVNFDGCGGNAGETSLTEETIYAGITLPNAYVNSDCAKEDWEFAGWTTSPVSEESNSLPLDIMPAGTLYNPTVNNGTLYAVYQLKTDKFKRITSLSDLRLGLNYVIATSTNRALSNTAQSTNYVASKSVTPASNIITTDDADIQWRIQGMRGAYEFYNAEKDVYLDLSSEGYALLTSGSAADNFVITAQSGIFFVRSIMALSNTKYLGFNSTYFNTVVSNNVVAIYFYQQQATYHSYPSCVEAVEALRWGADYVNVESYSLAGAPEIDNTIGDAVAQTDGTWRANYNSVLTPCTKVSVEWNGETSKISVPYVVANNTTSSSILGGGDCTECDLVVLPGATLTVNANKTLRNLTIYEGGKLLINNNVTLTTHALILQIDGDESSAPEVQFGGANATLNVKLGEIYLDRRIDEEDWYWFTLPYSAQLQEVSYSNLAANNNTAPVYRTNYFLKYYDGATRAADINAGSRQDTYWTHVAAAGSDYTIQAGQGYILGIADQKNITQPDGRKHTKRVLRFTMKPDNSWNAQEKSNGKVVPVSPSTVDEEKLQYNAGWNLIGNPYLHTYNTGTVGGSAGIRNGAWTKEYNDNNQWTGHWILDDNRDKTVPYISFFNRSTQSYEQVLANNCDILPFNAFFVQIEDNTQVNFANNMNAQRIPAYRRFLQEDTPVYTGIQLYSSNGKDRTGIVLSDDYSRAYEIGADLEKMENVGKVNLYTLSEGIKLAFNGLNDTDTTAIPVGMWLPVAGEYTFSFDTQYNPLLIDTLLLTDHRTGTVTNLLLHDYNFTAAAGRTDNRFTLRIVRRPQDDQPDVTTSSDTDPGQGDLWCAGVQDGILLCNHADAADIRIYDMTGKQLYYDTHIIGIRHYALPQGVYNLQVQAGGKLTVMRAIVR